MSFREQNLKPRGLKQRSESDGPTPFTIPDWGRTFVGDLEAITGGSPACAPLLSLFFPSTLLAARTSLRGAVVRDVRGDDGRAARGRLQVEQEETQHREGTKVHRHLTNVSIMLECSSAVFEAASSSTHP